MDTLTQGLLGALTTQAVAGRKPIKHLALLGFVAANFADLDVFIRNANPLTAIVYHRQFSHSLLFAPFGAVIALLILSIFFPNFRKHFLILWLASTLAYLSHVFLDCCTSYGTEALWPFSSTRIAWGFLPIIDPIMLIGLLVSAINSYRSKTLISWGLPLILLACYILFGAYQHSRIIAFLRQQVPSKQAAHIQFNAIPMIGQLYIWHGFYRDNQKIYSYIVNAPYLSSPYAAHTQSFPLFHQSELPNWVKENKERVKDYKIFSHFSDQYLTRIKRNPLVLANARYIRSIDPTVFLWSLQFNQNNQKSPIQLLWRQQFTPQSEP